MLLFAPMAAADEFRGGMYTNIYSLRPGYAEEAAAITRHAGTLGTRKLAILHARDGESLAALESAERTMTSMGANLLVKSAISSGSVANTVDKAMGAKPESILVISDSSVAANVVRELRAKGFRGPIYGFSNTGESLLAEQLGPAGAGVVVVRVVPKSDSSRVAVVRELQADAVAAKLGKPNVYMLEGYIAARVYAEAIDSGAGGHAAGDPPADRQRGGAHSEPSRHPRTAESRGVSHCAHYSRRTRPQAARRYRGIREGHQGHRPEGELRRN